MPHSMWTSRPFLLACLVNASVGVLYVWSLFLLPIETYLGAERSTLSLAPALSLCAFTLGMIVHSRLLRVLSLRVYALAAFGLAGAGHLLFALAPGLPTLLLGYGIVFGFGAGLGYGLALALATQMPQAVRSVSLGIVMAAFAVSGVVLSSLLAGPIQNASPSLSFLLIGVALLAVGLCIAMQLSDASPEPMAEKAGKNRFFEGMADKRFLVLGFVFFASSYAGLMVVAHATGIFSEHGVSKEVVGLAPGTLTLGYIAGSFLGGKLVDLLSSSLVLAVANLVTAVGVALLVAGASPALLLGTLMIGMVFGGSASLMPMLIGEQYGVEKIGDVYGKLMIAYGLAGLLAPWASGKLYSATGSYFASILTALGFSAMALLLGLTMDRGSRTR